VEVRRSALFVALMVVVGGALFFLIVASLFTIPLFALARFTEPSRGTDREWFRDGLRWAIGAGQSDPGLARALDIDAAVAGQAGLVEDMDRIAADLVRAFPAK